MVNERIMTRLYESRSPESLGGRANLFPHFFGGAIHEQELTDPQQRREVSIYGHNSCLEFLSYEGCYKMAFSKLLQLVVPRNH